MSHQEKRSLSARRAWIEIVVEYKKAKEKASSGKLTFTKTVALEDPESDFKNTLQYEYYNSMRK